MVAQRAASASLGATTSWPRAIGQGPAIRPALLQAFPNAEQRPGPGSGQVLGPDGMPSLPTAAQRLAQLQRSIAARGGSMPSPGNSWGRSFTQVDICCQRAHVLDRPWNNFHPVLHYAVTH